MNHDLFPAEQLHPEEEPDERYTPTRYFQPWHEEFRFTLDVCATAESAKCPRYFTKAQNGLLQDWRGERVWCNPPYSEIPLWVEYTWRAFPELAVMLVPAWTDRVWWAENVEPYRDAFKRTRSTMRLTTRFLRGRIPFGFPGNPEGVGVGNAKYVGYVLLIWRLA